MSESDTADIDAALDAAASSFKRTAVAEIAAIKAKMQNVLRVTYTEAPREALRLDLPAPRLQLRWADDHRGSYRWTCYYEMVIPLRKFDCRNDEQQGAGLIELSRTSVGGGAENRWETNDTAALVPFRDGAHIQWDNDAFGGSLPMYVIKPDGTAIPIPRHTGN